MKKYILSLTVLVMFATPAHALTVTCVNCSTNLIQMLDRITNVEQLSNAIKRYQEAVEQTRQQINMVRQNIEQYENMLQNTAQLPSNLVNELKNSLTCLANLSSTLRTQRGDIVALGEIFTNLFPEQALFGTLAGASPDQVEEANRRYRQEWDKWAESVDQASQATFQLSGQQLADLQRDPERFQRYIDDLLSTPDGQQKAIMAGNGLIYFLPSKVMVFMFYNQIIRRTFFPVLVHYNLAKSQLAAGRLAGILLLVITSENHLITKV